MIGILKNIRDKVLNAEQVDEGSEGQDRHSDNLIALGVLLWEVAQADKKFLPEEQEKMKSVLNSYSEISDKDFPIVLRAIKVASLQKIDLYSFTHEVSTGLPREAKIAIIENLFRVACIDNDLDHEEHEMIRKITGLFRLDHTEFITAKVKVKKEFGLDTAGL